MKRCATLVATLLTFTGTAHAGVKTLTSDEMVDTYVKDSAIIVVPREQQKSEAEKQRVIKALTISPGEPVISESEEQAELNVGREPLAVNRLNNLEQAREDFVRRTLAIPSEALAAAAPPDRIDFSPVELPSFGGQQIQVPNGPFTQTFQNNQLGLSSDGQRLTFSIGNPSGVDRIDVPRPINSEQVQLTPRPGGGFDLSIKIPEN